MIVMIGMKGKILVVEDSLTQRTLLCDLLREDGYEVVEALNGHAGVQQALAHRPDLILTDVEMPVMDGIEMCKRLKENPATAEIPVVIMSTHDNDTDVRRGLEVGAVDYIPKDACADASVLAEVEMMLTFARQSRPR
jgi:CheY-like chemotaxis protein